MLLRSLVRDLYGNFSLMIFDLIVRESQLASGVSEDMLAMFVHASLRTVHTTCKELQRTGLVIQSGARTWLFREDAAVKNVVNMCTRIIEAEDGIEGMPYECKSCGTTRDLMDVWEDVARGTTPRCCDAEMTSNASMVDDFKLVIRKFTPPQQCCPHDVRG